MSFVESSASETISESLETQVKHIIEEARMVLPGIQTLFGNTPLSMLLAMPIGLFFIWLWFLQPWRHRCTHHQSRK